MPKLSVAALLGCCIACASCTGTIDDGRTGTIDDGRGARPGAPIIPGEPGAPPPSTTEADDRMRAEDPELFDVASHYFPGTTVSGGKKRLFRLTRSQLDRTTQALLPSVYEEPASAAMPPDPLQTNYEYSENLSWNGANLTPYAAWVAALAARVEADPSAVIDCPSASEPACMDQAARRFVTRAFRGAATPEQLDRFAGFFADSVLERGLAAGAADLADVVLTSPGYVFRDEVTTDGTGTLAPAQRLQHLTYALADVPPEVLQLTSDDGGALEAVLESPLAREKLQRFILAWLEVREPQSFGLAANVFPEWTEEVAAAAVDNTRAFVARALSEAEPSLKSLTHATGALVSPETAFLYERSASAPNEPVELPQEQRLGIFSQPAVVASHSGPTTTRLVKRGVFFTRKIMCLPLGAPPDGVDTTVPTTPGATERQRIEGITANQPCAGCHAYINPFGFMQESYDALGRFRTRDESGLPIDPSIAIEFLDEGPLTASTSVEALRALTASARFKQCFTRQLFRYYMGREEEKEDNPVLRQMFFAFAKDDRQDMFAALRALATSVVFTQRTEAP